MDNQKKNYNVKLFLPLHILLIVYLVFMFKALLETQWDDVTDVCQKSNLWYYLTTVFILNIFNKNDNNDNKDTDKERKNSFFDGIFLFFCSIGLFIWGAYELFGIGCVSELKSTLLYKLSLASWILSCVVLGICIIAMFGLCCTFCCLNDDDNPKSLRTKSKERLNLDNQTLQPNVVADSNIGKV